MQQKLIYVDISGYAWTGNPNLRSCSLWMPSVFHHRVVVKSITILGIQKVSSWFPGLFFAFNVVNPVFYKPSMRDRTGTESIFGKSVRMVCGFGLPSLSSIGH